jgi:hypothetical protein
MLPAMLLPTLSGLTHLAGVPACVMRSGRSLKVETADKHRDQ